MLTDLFHKVTATSAYLNRPIRTYEQAKAEVEARCRELEKHADELRALLAKATVGEGR